MTTLEENDYKGDEFINTYAPYFFIYGGFYTSLIYQALFCSLL